MPLRGGRGAGFASGALIPLLHNQTMKRKPARRQDLVKRERFKTANGKEAKAAINRQMREARAQMVEQSRRTHDVAATIAPWLGGAWEHGLAKGGNFRYVDHRYKMGIMYDIGRVAGGHVRPELRSAFEDALVELNNSRAEWDAWSCKDQQHRSSPHDELCTSRAFFGQGLVKIGAGFNDVIGRAMYLVQPDNLYGRGQLEGEVERIHRMLCRLADSLIENSAPRSMPEIHPPRYERLRVGVLERLFRADLDARIEAGYSLLRNLKKGKVALKKVSSWSDDAAVLLARGLSDETVRGFRRETKGGRICKIQKVDRVTLGSAYLELGLVYLEEVRKRLPDYVEAAGMRSRVSSVLEVRNRTDGSVGNAVQAGLIYGDVHFHGNDL